MLGVHMKRMMAVFVLSILAVITAETIRYLAAADRSEPLLVVHDADPGADDAMAILMLLSPKSRADLLAVTCVQGNTGVLNTSQNTWLVLELANRTQVPVYSGSEYGLTFQSTPDHFFGYDGLGDAFQRPKDALISEQHAANALIEIVKKHPDKVSLLCTGPLTNIALALHLYPKFLQDLKEIVVLGGSYKGGGNKKPGAEFNIVFDPEAAAFVFSNVPEDKLITLVPLETVLASNISLDWRLNVLGSLDSSWMHFLNLAERKSFERSQWNPFDQTAAALLLDPAVATGWVQARVQVETCGVHGRGALFLDYGSPRPNLRVVTELDVERIKAMLLDLMS